MSTEVGLARSVDFAIDFYSMVFDESYAIYGQDIPDTSQVKPKLLRLQAPYIRNTVAIRKNMYAMNIGGVG